MALMGNRLGSSLASEEPRRSTTIRMNPLSRQAAGASGRRGMRTSMVRSFQPGKNQRANMVGPVSQRQVLTPPVYLKGSAQDPTAGIQQGVAQVQGGPAMQPPGVDMGGIYGPGAGADIPVQQAGMRIGMPVGQPIGMSSDPQMGGVLRGGGSLPSYIVTSDSGEQFDLRKITNQHELSRLPDDVWKKITGSDRLKEVVDPGESPEGALGATPEGGLGGIGGYTGFGGIGSAVKNAMGYNSDQMGRDLSGMGQKAALGAIGALGAGATSIAPAVAYGAATAGAHPVMLGAKFLNSIPRYYAAVREDQKMNDLARQLGLSEEDVAEAAKAGISMSGFDKSVSGVDRSKFGKTDDMSPAMANLASQIADSVNSIRGQPSLVDSVVNTVKENVVDPVADFFSRDEQSTGYSPGEFAGYSGSVSAPDPGKFGDNEGWGGFGGRLGSGWGNFGAGFARGGYGYDFDPYGGYYGGGDAGGSYGGDYDASDVSHDASGLGDGEGYGGFV